MRSYQRKCLTLVILTLMVFLTSYTVYAYSISPAQTPVPTAKPNEYEGAMGDLNTAVNHPLVTLGMIILALVSPFIVPLIQRIRKRKASKLSRQNKAAQEKYDKLQNKIKTLSDEIALEIPKQAKRSAIVSKVNVLKSEILSMYDQYKELVENNKDILSGSEISPEIEMHIRNEISGRADTAQKKYDQYVLRIVSIVLLFYIINSEAGIMFIHNFINTIHANLNYDIFIRYIMGISIMSVIISLFRYSRIRDTIAKNSKNSFYISLSILVASIYVVFDVSYDLLIPESLQVLSGAITTVTIPFSINILHMSLKI